MALELKRRRFTVQEYHRMARAGILGEDDRVELIEGEIIEMTPVGVRHAACVKRLAASFFGAFSDAATVSVQDPIRLGRRSEPQPDLALLVRRADFYSSRPPTPTDVLLLVEVADTTAEPDRRAKVPLCARNGIREVWVVDLQQETITVYQDPAPDGYRTARIARRDEQLAPSAFPDRPLAVADLLPA